MLVVTPAVPHQEHRSRRAFGCWDLNVVFKLCLAIRPVSLINYPESTLKAHVTFSTLSKIVLDMYASSSSEVFMSALVV